MNIRYTPLAEDWKPGLRLGRHVAHDARSLAYALPAGKPQTVEWDARIGVLDQGSLGSCVGNATVGALGTEPLYSALPKELQGTLDENLAIRIYSEATKTDPFPGWYDPTTGSQDTGTDGLDGAKAAQRDGYLSGYQHALGIDACYTAIAGAPFITGISWYSGMDNPTSEGVVHATGTIRGGHEVCVVGYNATTGLWKIRNSWSDLWGKGGYFFLPDEDYDSLLKQQGDATTLTPVTQPAPTPTPTPPSPTPGVQVPPEIVDWAELVVTEKWRKLKDRKVAQWLINLAAR